MRYIHISGGTPTGVGESRRWHHTAPWYTGGRRHFFFIETSRSLYASVSVSAGNIKLDNNTSKRKQVPNNPYPGRDETPLGYCITDALDANSRAIVWPELPKLAWMINAYWNQRIRERLLSESYQRRFVRPAKNLSRKMFSALRKRKERYTDFAREIKFS